MTSQYELILLVDEITPEQEDLIYDEYDALAATHTGSTRLTVTVQGATIFEGAHRLLAFLQAMGVRPRQFCEDFVTRADIAERAEVSRQAVGLWVRGERQGSFPDVYSSVGGGIWLFGEVESWLRGNVTGYVGAALNYPARVDHVALAELLLRTLGQSAYRVDFTWEQVLTIDSSTVGASSSPGPILDRHVHGWSRVAQVRGVDLTLAA